MNAVRRIFAALGDSPTYERDRANLISGFTIGTTGLLLNGAILFFVLPLLMDPDDPSFRAITEHIGFGQTLALILLGGATLFATLLIPLRLASVFWGPRIGRYFDQIVLSGISPMRFVIGKAMSQNLFLALILFLLLPYLVLSLTLGGVNWSFFLAGLFLVWLYCMALAMVTLWLSLYLNELVAALCVIFVAAILCGLGSTPIPFLQPFCVTPMPVLLQPVYESMPFFTGNGPGVGGFRTAFISCGLGMSAVIGLSLFGIYLGPLFGIIRDNSTFGEVVRSGDSKRKRRFRLRHHIQRPSEIAFFYENRSARFRNSDGLLRWGMGLGCLTAFLLVARMVFYGFVAFAAALGAVNQGMHYGVHVINLIMHGVGLVLAVFLFSHAKNTLYLRTPFFLGRKFEVAKLDAWCFFLFASLSTALALLTPSMMESQIFQPRGGTVFPLYAWRQSSQLINFPRVHIEGILILTLAGTTIYLAQRHLCHMTWMRIVAFVATCGTYAFFICMLPLFLLILSVEMVEFQDVQWLTEGAERVAVVSPVIMFGKLFDEVPRQFADEVSTVPFYAVHGCALLLIPLLTMRLSRRLKGSYLTLSDEPTTKPVSTEGKK